MNHDETNSHPEIQPWIEPELEARVIAWIAGEASPFEVAELERLCAEKPELAMFKRRIEAVQGLVGQAMRPDDKPLHLSAERRAKLLETLTTAADEKPAEDKPVVVAMLPPHRRNAWQKQIWMTGIAACAAFAVFCAMQMSQDFSVSRKMKVAEGRDENETQWLRQKLALREEDARQEVAQAAAASGANEKRLLLRSEKVIESGGMMGGRGGGGGAGGRSVDSLAKNQAPGSAPVPAVQEVSRFRGVTAPAVADAAVVTMSPFEVKADRDAGYMAANTLSGSRIDTNLKDLALANAEGPKRELGAAGYTALADSLSAFSQGPALPSTAKEGLGYVALGTLSGSRLNTALEDKAASISVVTKQELTDTPVADVDNRFIDVAASAKPAPAAAKKAEAVEPPPRPREPAPAPTSEESSAGKEPVSTFSLHVSQVSFQLAKAALARGELPDAAQVRPEEFYNAFNYGDPAPTMAEKVGARIEQAAHPFMQQRNLVRIALKVPATGRSAGQPLRLTVLLDTSGSMQSDNRVAILRRAMAELVALLGSDDRITLIGFARQPRILADDVRGNQAGSLVDLIARTPAEGGTNLEEALKIAGELARRHQIPAAQNRIVLLTDGAANLGNARPAELAAMIEALRQQGIALDACGIGLNGLDDDMLEALTRKGDGRYTALDSPEAADAGFARQLAGAFRPAAQNVKVQVRFNPERVGSYRLIGFERHRLREEDFRNDQVDAAELAAEEAAVALYQIEAKPQGSGELGEVSVRFRDTATGEMVERSWAMTYEAQPRAFDRATPAMQLAGTSALLAEKLRGSPVAQQFKLGDFAAVVNALRGVYAAEPRVQEFATMFGQTRRLKGE